MRLQESYNTYRGEITITVKDRSGRVVDRIVQPNLIKIGAKEMLAHRITYGKVWDPNEGTGNGGWVAHDIDVDEEMAAKYIIFGASFDENGAPLDSTDTRYYTADSVTGSPIANRLGPGAEFDGGLINAIPITEPSRPLKKIEQIYYTPSYQPAGTPMLQDDVRAVNNIVVMSTTLRLDEYNGFGSSDSDFFTITEVALAGGKELGQVGCDCDPTRLFLEGRDDDTPIRVSSGGGEVLTIHADDLAYSSLIKEGDQIKLVAEGDSSGDSTLDLITPHYLVVRKETTGGDIVLDRAVQDSNNEPLSGTFGIYRNSLRIFSHRILATPFKKSSTFEIEVSWSIVFS